MPEKQPNGNNYIKIFDTTLRDGEQCPGASMTQADKLAIALQLEKLNVDVIEAGFPVSSPVQFQTVEQIAVEVRNPIIAALARAVKMDIKVAAKALHKAYKPRIHTFIATSNIHMKYKLNKGPSEVLKSAVEAVKIARNLVEDIEFSAEDASRSELSFLIDIVEAVIEAGATTINLPDTVGYTTPEEYGSMFSVLCKKVKNIDQATLSAHCHNDLGLAVGNSLYAVLNGARQIECTINGIGERAGNTAMEEVVMAIKTRNHIFPFITGINAQAIYRTSKMVARSTGLVVQRNKAIVGFNAFAHESGIHQDGMLKNRLTYEIMTPESIGLQESKLILGRHSGRAGLKSKLENMNIILDTDQFEKVYHDFVKLADSKKSVFEEDLLLIMQHQQSNHIKRRYILEDIQIESQYQGVTKIKICINDVLDNKQFSTEFESSSIINTVFCALEQGLNIKTKLEYFNIVSNTQGKDGIGETSVGLLIDNQSYYGKSFSTDIVYASGQAFLEAVNNYVCPETKVIRDSGI